MTRIEKRFKELKQKNKKAFITFITAGYPNLGVTEKLILEFSRTQVDIIELGVPFSDPLADGPVIQESSQEALKRKVNLDVILDLVRKLRRKTEVPICLMTYYNPIFCFGEERFCAKARACGVDGVIIPDLPPEEAGPFVRSANKHNLDVIYFISPTTSLKRIKYIGRISKGFIYYVSLTGVTGTRENVPWDLAKNIKTIKKYTRQPICAGFGISSRLQVKQVCKIADGVIVGSAVIKKIKENIGRRDLVKRIGNFVKNLNV